MAVTTIKSSQLRATAVSAASYSVANITVNAQGQLTAASSGAINDLSDVTISSLADNEVLLSASGTFINQTLAEAGIQAQSDVLDDLNTLGVVASDGQFIVGTASGVFAYESANTARTSLGLGTGDSPTFTNVTVTAAPTSDSDLANKAYVDSVAAGLDPKESCRVATTEILDDNTDISGSPTYNSTAGTASRGQITATLAVTGVFAIDGIALADGDRVLIKNAGDGSGLGADANGIWAVTIVTTSLTLDRTTDFDEDDEVTNGAFTFIGEGTVNGGNGFVLTTPDPIIIGGASGTDLTFSQFSGAGQVIAGDGLVKDGNTLDVVGTSNRIIANANSIDIDSAYVGQTSIVTLGTVTTGTWTASVIDHERGGLESDVSAFSGLLAISGGTTSEINSKSELEGQIADVSDFAEADGDTYTGVHDFGGATSLEVPNAANPTVNANGQVAVETSITGFTNGLMTFFSTAQQFVLSVLEADIPTVDGTVASYNATTDKIEFVAPSSSTTFVTREEPSGLKNGSNKVYTLAGTPTSGSEEIYFNGVLLTDGSGNDYQISGLTITLEAGFDSPVTADEMRVSYRS